MQRPPLMKLAGAIASALCAASALAQQGDLAGVTMRVLDDVSDVPAVILDLDANRGEDDEAADADETTSSERDAAADAEQPSGRREREALHDPDDDERSEGKLEDNDVEVPAVAPVP